jgi:hypothetical protein
VLPDVVPGYKASALDLGERCSISHTSRLYLEHSTWCMLAWIWCLPVGENSCNEAIGFTCNRAIGLIGSGAISSQYAMGDRPASWAIGPPRVE